MKCKAIDKLDKIINKDFSCIKSKFILLLVIFYNNISIINNNKKIEFKLY
jgi:hypothetical protein